MAKSRRIKQSRKRQASMKRRSTMKRNKKSRSIKRRGGGAPCYNEQGWVDNDYGIYNSNRQVKDGCPDPQGSKNNDDDDSYGRRRGW